MRVMSLKGKTVLVYLPLKQEMAKLNNLPVKLPVLAQDMPLIVDSDKIELDIILRGLEAQFENSPDDYYGSYLQYYYYEAFKRALSESDFKEAVLFLEKAGKLKKDYRYHFYYGLYYREVGDLELAEIELRKTLEKNSDFYVGYYELGRLLQSREEWEEAARFYIQSIEKSAGQFALPFVGVIDTYIAAGAYSSALEIMDRVGESFPLRSEVLLRKGVVLNVLERFEEARKTFEKCLRLERSWRCRYNRAYSLARLGRPIQALQDLRTAYKLAGEKDILYEIAIAEKNLGLAQDALSHCDEYYTSSKDEKGLFLMVRLLDMLGEYERALDLLEGTEYGELRNTVLFHMGFERGTLAQGLSFEDPIVQSVYNSELERISRESVPEAVSPFIRAGSLDLEYLVEFLLTHGSVEVRERVSRFLEGRIPEEDRRVSLEEAGLYASILLEIRNHPSGRELLSYTLPFLMSGRGFVTAAFRILLHVLVWKSAGIRFSGELFLDEYLEELRDLDWEFSTRLARFIQEGAMDIDTLEEEGTEDLEDFVLLLVSALEKGTLDELDLKGNPLKAYIEQLKSTGG